jgi:hypothetical protein
MCADIIYIKESFLSFILMSLSLHFARNYDIIAIKDITALHNKIIVLVTFSEDLSFEFLDRPEPPVVQIHWHFPCPCRQVV